jgi:hypothetical protein
MKISVNHRIAGGSPKQGCERTLAPLFRVFFIFRDLLNLMDIGWLHFSLFDEERSDLAGEN